MSNKRGSIKRRVPKMSPEQRQRLRDKKEELREMRIAEAIARQRQVPLDTEDFARLKPEVRAAVAAVTGMTEEEFIVAVDTEIQNANTQPGRGNPPGLTS